MTSPSLGPSLGFAGLGQMGGPMAANIAGGGFPLIVHDKAGTVERAPSGASAVDSLKALAASAETLFLSLPDGPASLDVVRNLAGMEDITVKQVIDLSTIGPEAAREADGILRPAGIVYIDAPVSGGQAGAKAGTITVMWAGPKDVLDTHREVMESFSKNLFHVGPNPGQGQAMKLLNNFLSGTAMVATSEAMAFGLSQGLKMETMLDVVNVSTGRNSATSDKFPNRIATGTYDAGFKTTLLTKDISLFLENARAAGTPSAVAGTVADLWRRCDEAMPDSDFTRIYEFLSGQEQDQ